MTRNTTFLGLLGLGALVCLPVACEPLGPRVPSAQLVTAGYSGCRSSDVVVGNEERHDGSREWDAWCNSEKWHCTGPTWGATWNNQCHFSLLHKASHSR